MPFLSQRVLEPELMDQPGIDWDAHREALEGLERINAFSLAYRPIWEAVLEMAQNGKKLKILDIATGAGDLPFLLARKAKQGSYDFEIHACDKSAQAIQHLRKKAARSGSSIDFFVLDIKREKIPAGYDILINSLFLHHLTHPETAAFLKDLKASKPAMILVNDLIRSQIGFFLAYFGTRLLSSSKVVHHDGPQSVKAAYTLSEVAALLREAGLENARLKTVWPERFLMTWKN